MKQTEMRRLASFLMPIGCFFVLSATTKSTEAQSSHYPPNLYPHQVAQLQSQVAKRHGSFISKTRDSIPSFPSSLPGYYHVQGKDFWGKPYQESGSIRVFEASHWEELPNFPYTQNGCSSGRFMVRWISASPDMTINASLALAGRVIEYSESGTQGYMVGSNCHQPRFRVSKKASGNQSTLTDVYYEVRFWRAGV